MQHQNTKIMIISTQTPDEEKMKLNQIAPGKTGTVIQELTDGGMVSMHRDKHLREGEKEVFQRHLANNGWLIITGHGGRSQGVGGQYIPADIVERDITPTLDIRCSAEDYVNLTLESGALKSGSHINVLLFVCYAAKRIDDKDSFAELLAEEFSKKGISSQIVASIAEVGRIGDYNRKEGDVQGERVIFRAAPEEIRIFETPAGKDGKASLRVKYITSECVEILKDRVQPIESKTPIRIMTEAGYLQALKTLPIEVNKFKWLHYKDLERASASDIIEKNHDLIIFRKGSDGTSIVCSLYSEKRGRILHHRFPCAVDKNKQWTVTLDAAQVDALIKIKDKVNPPDLHHSLGNSTGLWLESDNSLPLPQAEKSSGHTPRSPKGND